MLEKLRELKDLSKMKDNLCQVMEQQSQAAKGVEELQQAITAAKEQLERLQKTQEEFTKQFSEAMGSIKTLSQDFKAVGAEFEHELNSFHLLKSELQKRLIKEAEEKISQLVREIQEKTDPYKEIESRSKELGKQLDTAAKELEKFSAISKAINEKDFELAKFGKMLEQNDREKLDLMRRIDTLERLLAVMKRGRVR